MKKPKIRQREIWQVFFDPVLGREQAENRPAVVISGNTLNINLDVIIVCPLASKVHGFEGNPILRSNLENGLNNDSEVLVFHVRSISKNRFKRKVGKISSAELIHIKNTLNDLLKY
jgi:mRNA interferase MazF